MIKWEYLTAYSNQSAGSWNPSLYGTGSIYLYNPSDGDQSQANVSLHELGKRGWDLVSMSQQGDRDRCANCEPLRTIFLFKRVARETLESCEEK